MSDCAPEVDVMVAAPPSVAVDTFPTVSTATVALNPISTVTAATPLVAEVQLVCIPGTEIIGVPAAQWPPMNPQPDTLYLKLE